MRYRKQSASGDMQFGHGGADFWYNVPDAVGLAVKTRLLLFRGEWFADTSEGTPWGGFPLNDLVIEQGRILGKNSVAVADMAIKERVVSTPGILGVQNYSSSFDPNRRSLTMGMTIDTIYGVFLLSLGVPTSNFFRTFTLGVSPLGGSDALG